MATFLPTYLIEPRVKCPGCVEVTQVNATLFVKCKSIGVSDKCHLNLKLKVPIFRGRQVSICCAPSFPQLFHAFFPPFLCIIKMLPKRHFSLAFLTFPHFYTYIFSFLVLRIWNTFFFSGFISFCALALLPSFYTAGEWLFIRLRPEICAGAFEWQLQRLFLLR